MAGRTVSVQALQAQMEAALEDVARIEEGHLRGISATRDVRRSIGQLWEAVLGEEAPEYEPEIRLVKSA